MFPIIDTAGAPYEVGVQHGRQAAARVRACYRRFCDAASGDAAERARLAALMEATLATRRPQALEEMHGIADGAELPYEQIRDLNFSVELWADTFLDPPRGCTLIGVGARGEGPLLAKTLDAWEGDERLMVVQRVAPAEGHRFLHLTFAGTLWTDGGVNEAGLGTVGSSLCTRARNEAGFPVFIMARALLQECGTTEAAVARAVASDAINYGTNIMLADTRGELAVVERSATRVAVRRPEAGVAWLAATNHSLAPELEATLGGSTALRANSRARLERVIAGGAPPDSSEALQTFVADHREPGGLCQHGQADLYTIGAIVVAPRQRRIWLREGPPCGGPFTPVALDAVPVR